MEKIDKQKIVDFKNLLFDEAREYYDWASINENEVEQKIELCISTKLEQIANRLEKIIYD